MATNIERNPFGASAVGTVRSSGGRVNLGVAAQPGQALAQLGQEGTRVFANIRSEEGRQRLEEEAREQKLRDANWQSDTDLRVRETLSNMWKGARADKSMADVGFVRTFSETATQEIEQIFADRPPEISEEAWTAAKNEAKALLDNNIRKADEVQAEAERFKTLDTLDKQFQRQSELARNAVPLVGEEAIAQGFAGVESAIDRYEGLASVDDMAVARSTGQRRVLTQTLAGYNDANDLAGAKQIMADLTAGKYDAGLMGEDRAAVVKSARDTIQAIEAGEDKREKEQRTEMRAAVKAGLEDETAALRATGQRAGVISDAQIIEAYGAEDGEEIIAGLERERSFFLTTEQMGLTSIEEDRQIMAGLKPEGVGFAEESERREIARKVLAEKYKRLGIGTEKPGDPVGYLVAHSEEMQRQIEKRTPEEMVTTLLDEQWRLGVPMAHRRALADSQVNDLVSRFETADTGAARADLAATLQQEYGQHWDKVLGELQAGGLDPMTGVLAELSLPGQQRARVALGEAIETGAAELRKTVATEDASAIRDAVPDALAELRATLAPVFGGTGETARWQNAAELLALQYHNAGMTPQEAVDRAARELVNDHYDFASTYRIPRMSGASVNDVEVGANTALMTLGNMPLEVPPSYLFPELSDEERKSQYVRAIQDKGFWVTNDDESGVALMSEMGAPVLLENGRPVMVLFADVIGRGAEVDAGLEEVMQ